MKPLLINRRKFDIRVFAVAVAHLDSAQLRCYIFDEGYLRTSSKEFSTSNFDNKFVHLTNDAVQKNSTDYGRYESGNKMSYSDFEKFLMKERQTSFEKQIKPKIKQQVKDTFAAAGLSLYRGSENKAYNGFEILGFDFMLDSDLNCYLIEVNTNPALDCGCLLL